MNMDSNIDKLIELLSDVGGAGWQYLVHGIQVSNITEVVTYIVYFFILLMTMSYTIRLIKQSGRNTIALIEESPTWFVFTMLLFVAVVIFIIWSLFIPQTVVSALNPEYAAIKYILREIK